MPENVGFEVDFDALTDAQHRVISRICFGYAMQVVQETRNFIAIGQPFSEEIADHLEKAPMELVAPIGNLTNLLGVFFERLATQDQTFSALLLAEISKGETKQ
jgi:threonine synthase